MGGGGRGHNSMAGCSAVRGRLTQMPGLNRASPSGSDAKVTLKLEAGEKAR